MTHSFPPRRSADLLVHQRPDVRCAFRDGPLGEFLAGDDRFDLRMRAIACDERGERRPALLGGQRLREIHVAEGAVAIEEWRSEEHTSELQSLMRISYAVFCLNNKKNNTPII